MARPEKDPDMDEQPKPVNECNAEEIVRWYKGRKLRRPSWKDGDYFIPHRKVNDYLVVGLTEGFGSENDSATWCFPDSEWLPVEDDSADVEPPQQEDARPPEQHEPWLAQKQIDALWTLGYRWAVISPSGTSWASDVRPTYQEDCWATSGVFARILHYVYKGDPADSLLDLSLYATQAKEAKE